MDRSTVDKNSVHPFPFFRLPLELRREIYYYSIFNWHREELLESGTRFTNTFHNIDVNDEFDLFPPFIRASKAVKSEAIPILLSKFVFFFRGPSTLTRYVSPTGRNLIRYIGFGLENLRTNMMEQYKGEKDPLSYDHKDCIRDLFLLVPYANKVIIRVEQSLRALDEFEQFMKVRTPLEAKTLSFWVNWKTESHQRQA